MTATVSEVSNALGLEQSLVQKVLDAGIDAVPEDQIQMILKTAKEMGYQRKPHRLGIVYEEESSRGLTHPFFSLILNEFKTEAESRGYDITFLHPVRNQNADGYVSSAGKISSMACVWSVWISPLPRFSPLWKAGFRALRLTTCSSGFPPCFPIMKTASAGFLNMRSEKVISASH